MSIGSSNKRIEAGRQLVNELRQSYGLAPLFFRAAAARSEMIDTDMQVIDILENNGDATAGQLASLMGLTTGTFTAILNRLEKAGVVLRERDPDDGRRVIVKLATNADGKQAMEPLFALLEDAWEEMAAQYDDEQKALLLEFLQRSNTLAREEITRLRETSGGDESPFSAPLGNLKSAQLVFHSEGGRLSLSAGELKGALYQVSFEGPMPDVKVKEGVLTIRYPKRLWVLGKDDRAAEITLNTAIPWQITLKGSGSQMSAELESLDLLELEVNGAGSTFHVGLPDPKRVVPIRLGGSGSEFNIQRPPDVAMAVQQKGWGSSVNFDDQTIGGGRVQSPNYGGATLRYDIETSGSGSMVTITSG